MPEVTPESLPDPSWTRYTVVRDNVRAMRSHYIRCLGFALGTGLVSILTGLIVMLASLFVDAPRVTLSAAGVLLLGCGLLGVAEYCMRRLMALLATERGALTELVDYITETGQQLRDLSDVVRSVVGPPPDRTN